MAMLSPRVILAGLGLGCAASVAAALLAQHHFGMQPCPWCILQRFLFMVIAALSLSAAALPQALPRRILSALILPLAVSGGAAALWQHFVAAKSDSCALTLADKVITFLAIDTRWPEIFEVRASCADAAASIIGVPFEFWSLALFTLASLVLIYSSASTDSRA